MASILQKALGAAAEIAPPLALQQMRINAQSERDETLARIAKSTQLGKEGRSEEAQIRQEGRAGKEYDRRLAAKPEDIKSFVTAEFKSQEEAGIFKGDPTYRTITQIERDMRAERSGKLAGDAEVVEEVIEDEEGPGVLSRLATGAKDLISGAMEGGDELTPAGGRKGRKSLAEAKTKSKAEGEAARGEADLSAAKKAVLGGSAGNRPASKSQQNTVIDAMLARNPDADEAGFLESLISDETPLAKGVRARAKARLAALRSGAN